MNNIYKKETNNKYKDRSKVVKNNRRETLKTTTKKTVIRRLKDRKRIASRTSIQGSTSVTGIEPAIRTVPPLGAICHPAPGKRVLQRARNERFRNGAFWVIYDSDAWNIIATKLEPHWNSHLFHAYAINCEIFEIDAKPYPGLLALNGERIRFRSLFF